MDESFISSHTFDGIVDRYLAAREDIQAGGDLDAVRRYYERHNRLEIALVQLAERIANTFKFKCEIYDDLVVPCFDQMDRLTGSALNYFTTVMLGHARQLYRSGRLVK